VVVCGQRTKVKTVYFPGHKVLLVREIGNHSFRIILLIAVAVEGHDAAATIDREIAKSQTPLGEASL
jgi:hypothetical protein